VAAWTAPAPALVSMRFDSGGDVHLDPRRWPGPAPGRVSYSLLCTTEYGPTVASPTA
jgi:hypothetical protein